MTDAEALDLAVSRTGHERYRALLDPSHPAYNPWFWPKIRAIAAGEAPAPAVGPPLVPFDAAEFAAIRACPHRMKEPCGCSNPYRCRASYGQPATVEDCRRCLRARSGE